jgi:ATP-dependent RNA helicase RhlB
MKFTEWNFDPRIQQGIADMGFEECTPVQAETFQLIMEGKDIQAQSQTGTGKTAAFMIGAFHLLLTDESLKGRKVLVVAPTRELADQIEKEALALGKHLDFTIGSFYGGVGIKKQEDLLRNGVDIVIGTPGRLLDFSKSKKLDFSEVGILVIDEADRMFDMGFYPDIRKILEKMGPKEERKSLLLQRHDVQSGRHLGLGVHA